MKGKIAFVLLFLGLVILSNAHAGFQEELAGIEARAEKMSGAQETIMVTEPAQATQVIEKPIAVPMNATAPYYGSYNDYSIRISDMHSDGSLVSITVVNTGNYVLHDVNIAVAPLQQVCNGGEACPTMVQANQVVATINELYAGQKITVNVWIDYKTSFAQVTTSEGASDSFWLDGGHNTNLEDRVSNLEKRVSDINSLILDLINLIKSMISSGATEQLMK